MGFDDFESAALKHTVQRWRCEGLRLSQSDVRRGPSVELYLDCTWAAGLGLRDDAVS